MQEKKYIASSFSVIFKAEIFLQGLLENIVNQDNFKNIQFVFVNPNSPDNSENILKPFLDKYDNFKYIKLEEDPGLYECWNIGVKNSDSEFVTNWNPDDRRTEDSITALYNYISELTEIDLVYGVTMVTKNKNEKTEDCNSGLIYPFEEFSIKNLFFHNSPHCMPLWRKSMHEKYGYFNNSYKSAGDGEMWLRAAAKGSKFALIKKIVGSYYESDETVSRDKNKIEFLVNEVYEMRSKILKQLMGLS